jgi:PAS domain S-box-containing protein
MDQRSFQTLLRRTVAIPVILLMLLAVVLAGEIVWLSSAQRSVDHSDQVIANARQLMRYMIDMETALRGYHITGDRSFLEPYNDAKPRVPEQLESLKGQVTDNPGQSLRLQQLRDLDLKWIQYAEGLLQQPTGRPLSSQDFEVGKRLMGQIRAKQLEFIQEEERLRETRYRRASFLSNTVIASALGLSLLIAILLFTLTRRELLQLSDTYEKHLRAEAEKTRLLREREEWFQITLNSLGDAVVATDAEGKVTFLNPVAQRLTGWRSSDATGLPLRDVLHVVDERTRAEFNDPVALVRRAQTVVGLSNHIALVSHTGQDYPLEMTGAPILNEAEVLVGIVIVFRDITQRRQTEQALRSSERLTLAGRLSATIAHEIRNPLDTVSNLIYLLQHEPAQSPSTQQYLRMASDELARITQITGQLLTFHREARTPVNVNIIEVLDSVLTLFAPQIRKNQITVEKRFEALPPVRGYPGELRQVFSNLVGNAIDAMPKGGKIILHLQESSHSYESESKGIRVSVVDNGSGIPPGVRKNLFAPFYTTKGEKGTGLGLWVSRGIIEKHEGTIHLTSTVRNGRSGTAFSVFLPFEQKLKLLDQVEVPPAG